MRPVRFDFPPFIVWRVQRPPDLPVGDAYGYRLVPQGVLLNLIFQCLIQSSGIAWVVFAYRGIDHASLRYVVALTAGVFILTLALSMLLTRLLNSRSMHPVEALMALCPDDMRQRLDQAFPCYHQPQPQKRSRFARLRANTAMTFQTALSLLPLGSLSSSTRNRLFSPREQENRARLRSLRMRREDNALHAFSAFAVVTSFVPLTRRARPIAAIQLKFVLSYFSPVAFGFIVCMLIFAIGGVGYGVKKPALMICIVLWFGQSLHYCFYTVRQDFAGMFENYFNQRPFPKSMTRFANEQMARAPDLVRLAQEQWLSAAITTAIFGLAGLYAGFLQNL